MDKRKEKTINAIYNAFANLIREKDYYDITMIFTRILCVTSNIQSQTTITYLFLLGRDQEESPARPIS